ncbi:lipid-A-disaccharide synthase [Maridesulfovibrio bastinii]|uniref:lipid-A-disaccharide synthase n=1 Tax=Maridesulfovibrio bastinii TaxID=47157 RepID=UPI00040A613F|nr:lipid-A-disaccharide synthase [Maridesulfovibrio bastinii]
MNNKIKKKIWINAGEASGDMHGALLAENLVKNDPDIEVMGMGGPAMEKAGCDIRYPMSMISLMGVTEVLPKLPRLLRLFGEIEKIWKKEKPAAVVLIDCPDFNFRLAKKAKRLGIPVYYYISPQVWAWRQGRTKFLHKTVRKILCILPFEKQFYNERGVDADYVGHPLLDLIPVEELDKISPHKNQLGILPGSRSKEISSLMPIFSEVARKLKDDHPELKFVIARAPGVDVKKITSSWPDNLDLEIVEPENRYEMMRSSSFLLAASGTATLESALIGTPTVIAYKMSAITGSLAKKFLKVKYVSLCNLILNREVLPELLQDNCTVKKIHAQAEEWVAQPEKTKKTRTDLKIMREKVGSPGAASRAAKIIMQDLKISE